MLFRSEKILALYRTALSRDPVNPLLILHLGKLYQRLEMLDEAVEVLSSLEAQDDRFPDLHRLLGALYLRLNNVRVAAEHFTRGSQLDLPMLLPYLCTACDFQTTQWSGRCPRCARWNTYQVKPLSEAKAQTRTRSLRRQSI